MYTTEQEHDDLHMEQVLTTLPSLGQQGDEIWPNEYQCTSDPDVHRWEKNNRTCMAS